MKKILIALLALAFLAGCTQQSSPVNGDFTDELIEEKTIIIGTSPDYPPYESLDPETGELIGFEIDLWNDLVKELDGYHIEWRQMEFDTIVTAVQTKQVDFGVSGFSYDPAKQVLFSDIYYQAGQTVLVKKDSDIHNADDLKGKLIAAQLGTTCAELAQSLEDVEVSLATDAKVLVEGLKAGAYDGVCLDTAVAMSYVDADDSLTVLDEELASDAYAFITSTDNEQLIAKLNELLADYMASDAFTALKDKWGF